MMLEQLSNAFGPSGCEGEVRDLIIRAIQDHVDDFRVDHLGNLIAIKRGRKRSSKLKMMIAAHMDEVGLMITHATAEGMLHFTGVGGVNEDVLATRRVKIGSDRVQGLILAPPIHVVPRDKRNNLIPMKEMVIDIGVDKKEAAESKCKKGDYAVFDTQYQAFGRGLASGKAFDDRVGCAMLIELLQRDRYPHDICAAFTTMEEIGLRGATVVGYDEKPDVAIVLEGTICEESPKKREESPITELGKGPAVTLADRGILVSRGLAQFAVQRATARGIPFQFKKPGVGGNDAGAIHRTGEGIPTLPINVPVRYIHGPVSVLSLEDMRQTIKLTEDVMREMTAGVYKKR